MDQTDGGQGRAWRRIPFRRRCKILLSAGVGQRPDAEVALDIGLCKRTVAVYRQRMNRRLAVSALLRARQRGRGGRTDQDLAPRVRDLARRGYSASAIALRLEITRERAARIAAGVGITLVRKRATEKRDPSDLLETEEMGRVMSKAAGDALNERYRKGVYGPLVRRMRPLAAKGLTFTEVWRRLGKPRWLVLRAARWGGVQFAKQFDSDGKQALADHIRPLAEAGRTQAEIARALHVPVSRVSAAADASGVPMVSHWKDWSRVDWTRTNEEIGREMGVRAHSVSLKRAKLRRAGLQIPPSRGVPSVPPPVVPWQQVDWTKANLTIARQWSVSAHAIGQLRLRLRRRGVAIPPSPLPAKEWWEGFHARAAAIAPQVLKLRGRGWTIKRIARKLRVTPAVAGVAARLAEGGVGEAKAPPDWASVDWTRSNREIAERLGVGPRTVAFRRSRLRSRGLDVPPSPRRTWTGRAPTSWDGVDWSQPNGVIAGQLGVAEATVETARGRLRRSGLQVPRSPFPSERLRQAMRARAEAAVERVRPLLRDGLKVGEIARRLGLSHGVAGIAVRIAKGEETPPVPKDEGPAPREEGEA